MPGDRQTMHRSTAALRDEGCLANWNNFNQLEREATINRDDKPGTVIAAAEGLVTAAVRETM